MPDPTLEEVQALIDACAARGGIVIKDPIWLAAFRINERKVKEYGRGRVFLAGDAAHIHSPAGGQGMNTGMQDAFNLAWKLALVIGGMRQAVAARQLLARAQRGGRHGAAQRRPLDRCGDHAQSGAARPAQHRGQVRAGLSPARPRVANLLAELDIGYPESPLTVEGAHRAQAPRPARAGRSACRPTPARRASPPWARPMPSPRWRQNFPSWCRRHRRPAGPCARPHPGAPDGYVGFAGAAADRAGAEAYLAALAAR